MSRLRRGRAARFAAVFCLVGLASGCIERGYPLGSNGSLAVCNGATSNQNGRW